MQAAFEQIYFEKIELNPDAWVCKSRMHKHKIGEVRINSQWGTYCFYQDHNHTKNRPFLFRKNTLLDICDFIDSIPGDNKEQVHVGRERKKLRESIDCQLKFFARPGIKKVVNIGELALIKQCTEMWVSDQIDSALSHAEEKHPGWPTSAVHAVAILAEESGELVRACNQYVWEDGSIEAIVKEAAQVGAMATRLLMAIGLGNFTANRCERVDVFKEALERSESKANQENDLNQ